MQGDFLQTLVDCLRMLVAVLGLAVAAEGYFRAPMNLFVRIGFATGSILLFVPSPLFWVVGFLVMLLSTVFGPLSKQQN